MGVRFRSRGRFQVGSRTATLAVGDVTAVCLFVATGLYAHAMHPLEYPVHALGAATPFLLGWLVVAPLGGAYAARTTRSLRATVRRVTLLWFGAALLGAALRATPLFHGGAPPSFVAVNVVLGLPYLLAWRVGFTWFRPSVQSA